MRQDPSDWTPVSTGRLLLRRLARTDYEAAVRIHTDPRTNRHNPSTPTVASAGNTLQAFLDHWDREGFGYWAVAQREAPDTVIGFTGLHRAVVDGRTILNLYYRYDPSVWGRGYATEGATEAVQRGRAMLPELPILARVTATNTGSRRTALAAGLRHSPGLDREFAGVPEMYFALGWPGERLNADADAGSAAALPPHPVQTVPGRNPR